jgi:hypothetical protein
MAIDVTLPLDYQNYAASFTTTNGTQCKILVDKNPPSVMATITNENPLPNEPSVRQRVYTGGVRVIDGTVSSTDGTARSLLVYEGIETTLFANMGAPTITGTNALNRTAGSFVTDGYSAGDQVMLFGDTVNAANNGAALIVTAVASGALTFNGTLLTNETCAAGLRVFRTLQRTRVPVAINSGNTDTAPSVTLFGGAQSQDKTVDTSGISLGNTGALIVGMLAAISALPAQVMVQAKAARY